MYQLLGVPEAMKIELCIDLAHRASLMTLMPFFEMYKFSIVSQMYSVPSDMISFFS